LNPTNVSIRPGEFRNIIQLSFYLSLVRGRHQGRIANDRNCLPRLFA
jgi:hypothetical protein